jgi:predicted nucleic acid-binding protein
MPSGRKNCFVDTNLLIYAVDPAEPEKRGIAGAWLMQMIRTRTLVLSPQSLNECYRVLTERRSMMPRNQARLFITGFMAFCTAPFGADVIRRAWRVQDTGEFGWWDCLLLGSALVAGCEMFLSEDMQHERTIDGMTIVNPFKLGPPANYLS